MGHSEIPLGESSARIKNAIACPKPSGPTTFQPLPAASQLLPSSHVTLPPLPGPCPCQAQAGNQAPPLPATVAAWLPLPLPKALPGALWRHTTDLSLPWFDAGMEGARKGGVQRKPCSCFLCAKKSQFVLWRMLAFLQHLTRVGYQEGVWGLGGGVRRGLDLPKSQAKGPTEPPPKGQPFFTGASCHETAFTDHSCGQLWGQPLSAGASLRDAWVPLSWPHLSPVCSAGGAN